MAKGEINRIWVFPLYRSYPVTDEYKKAGIRGELWAKQK